MRVSEVFYSLSGEGIHAGIPTIFVRLQGCGLRCSYCDTKYALDPKGGEELTPTAVEVRAFRMLSKAEWALITGGEPLQQADAVRRLVRDFQESEYKVEVETNGSIDPPDWFRDVDSWSVDVKCPSSGPAYGSFRTTWLKKLRKCDQLKFVVGTQEDLNFVRGFLKGAKLRPTVLVSPVNGVLLNKKGGTVEKYWNRCEWLQECAEFCKEQNVRMSLQLHKILYGDRRGV